MKKYPDKDPTEVLDYTEHFGDLLTTDIELTFESVTIEDFSPSTTADSTPLIVTSEELITNPTTGKVDSVLFWLSGGTLGLTYTILCTVKDDDTPQRTFTRRASIKVAKR